MRDNLTSLFSRLGMTTFSLIDSVYNDAKMWFLGYWLKVDDDKNEVILFTREQWAIKCERQHFFYSQ